MPTSARVTINEVDASRVVAPATGGVIGFIGETEMGPVGKPSDIISTWEQYQRLFGGLVDGNDFPLICKNALDNGARLRICRVLHYTDATDASTLTGAKASVTVQDGVNNLFTLTSKYEGAAYNNMSVVISAASNGNASYFNLQITFTGKSYINELYENLTITGTPTVSESNYLKVIAERSQLVDVTYIDASGYTGPLVPDAGTTAFTTGSDGGTIADTDYIGAATSQVGLYSMAQYSDEVHAICAPDSTSSTIHTAGETYAELTKEQVYWAWIGTSPSSTTLITARGSYDSDVMQFFGGEVQYISADNGFQYGISPMGHIAAAAAKTWDKEGMWYSFAGRNRGSFNGVVGVTDNFGGAANYTTLNSLAQRQINMVVQDNGQVYLSGNFTGALSLSKLSYASIRFLSLYIKKSLRPTLESYIEEPCDIATWKQMYNEVRPFLDQLVDRRGLASYRWDGDQDAPNLDSLTVNNKPDVGLGKYKVRLYADAINSLQDFTLDLVITNDTASITEV